MKNDSKCDKCKRTTSNYSNEEKDKKRIEIARRWNKEALSKPMPNNPFKGSKVRKATFFTFNKTESFRQNMERFREEYLTTHHD